MPPHTTNYYRFGSCTSIIYHRDSISLGLFRRGNGVTNVALFPGQDSI